MGDKNRQEVSERISVEKFDHSGEVPKLVEVVHVETTRHEDGTVDTKVTRVPMGGGE
jgi:hypothetical protein